MQHPLKTLASQQKNNTKEINFFSCFFDFNTFVYESLITHYIPILNLLFTGVPSLLFY